MTIDRWLTIRATAKHRVTPDGGSRCGLVKPGTSNWRQPADGDRPCKRCAAWTGHSQHCLARGGDCKPCRDRAARNRRRSRGRSVAARELVDGRYVATGDVEHGSASTYGNHGCRCEPCTAAWTAQFQRQRDQRKAARVEIDGRLVAVNASVHGTEGTYSNHGCRCRPCLDAHAARARKAATP